MPVTPRWVPATLKSMSPKWSSSPMMSVRRTWRFEAGSSTRPIEMPPTGSEIGTPASIRLSVAPQTDAIEEEPFDSRMSLITRIVYGNVAESGRTGATERSARAPWPISRRPGPRIGRTSPTANDGML